MTLEHSVTCISRDSCRPRRLPRSLQQLLGEGGRGCKIGAEKVVAEESLASAGFVA